MKKSKEINQKINSLIEAGFSRNDINEMLDFQEVLNFHYDIHMKESRIKEFE
jgi:hypothetical protein